IVAAVLSIVYVGVIASLNKKVVRDKMGNIDFKKSDVYFYWSRWDTIMVIAAIHTILCIAGLLVFLLRGDTINSPWIQFFIHQTSIFRLVTFIGLSSKLAD